MSDERVHFVAEESIRPVIERVFEVHRRNLSQLLPDADIQHIGGTSVSGSLTKGDLDIQVRVSQNSFAAAEESLSNRYGRNDDSVRTGEFVSFKDDSLSPPLGIQLTAIGSQFDSFCKLRELLRSRTDLLEQFNTLKRRHEGCSMEEYRAAKNAFLESILEIA